jgi:hypothetical protein
LLMSTYLIPLGVCFKVEAFWKYPAGFNCWKQLELAKQPWQIPWLVCCRRRNKQSGSLECLEDRPGPNETRQKASCCCPAK